uniref:Uncharacterized protein n=1 Tax=Oryza punctata TaxID=4537 RepID=A0A0E0LKS6_ORYPU
MMNSTSRLNSAAYEPPMAMSRLTCRARAWADVLISPDSIASLTIFSTTAASHTSFMSSPVLHTAPTNRLLISWSVKNGQHTIGTPSTAASSVEFQPACVRKHPTARWRSTSLCGAHPTTRSLLSPAAAVTASWRLVVLWLATIMSGRSTQRNG